LANVSAGAYQAPSRKTVSEVLDAWLSGPAAQTVRPQTLVSYRSVLNTYVLKVKPGGGITPLADRPIRSLTLADIDGLYAELRAPVTTKDAGGAETTAPRLSPRTVRYLHAILRSALHYAVRNRLIPHNPSDGATLPRQERGEITALDATLARAFLDATKDDRWHALFTLRLIGRLRPGEALALSLERHRVGRD
jgi:integrase